MYTYLNRLVKNIHDILGRAVRGRGELAAIGSRECAASGEASVVAFGRPDLVAPKLEVGINMRALHTISTSE